MIDSVARAEKGKKAEGDIIIVKKGFARGREMIAASPSTGSFYVGPNIYAMQCNNNMVSEGCVLGRGRA